MSTAFVVVELGYDEGDFEVVRVFTTRELADAFVKERSAVYVDPERFALAHFPIVEVPLD